MNLYDSADIGGLDLAQLAAATDHPRVLFVNNDVLGWRTFGDELSRATRARDDMYAVHLHFHDDRSMLRKLAERRVWRGQELRYAHGAVVRARATQLAKTLEAPRMTDLFDAIHVSPHLLALGIVRSRWQGPVSVIFDADVRKAKEILDGHMAIMGDLPAAVLSAGDPDDVTKYVEALVRDVGPEGLLLCPGCDGPIDSKPENFEAFVAAGRQFGRVG